MSVRTLRTTSGGTEPDTVFGRESRRDEVLVLLLARPSKVPCGDGERREHARAVRMRVRCACTCGGSMRTARVVVHVHAVGGDAGADGAAAGGGHIDEAISS